MIKKFFIKLRKIGKKLIFLLKLNSQKNVIFFGYSSFQIFLLNNISKKIDFYKYKYFVLYDLNKSSVGKTQFRTACKGSKLNIIYIENIGGIEFIFTTMPSFG